MTIDNDKLIKALAKLSPDEIQEILQNQEKTTLFKASLIQDVDVVKGKEHPSVRWREQQKNVVAFLESHFPHEAQWWDGWVVDFEFELVEVGRSDILNIILKRVDGEQKILKLGLSPLS